MASSKAGIEHNEAVKRYTREEVAAFLGEIGKQILESSTAHTHSMLALNHLLRLPYAREIFDEDLKEQARDLWLKVKSTGLQLNDPPLLFGEKAAFSDDYGFSEEETPAVDGKASTKKVNGRVRK